MKLKKGKYKIILLFSGIFLLMCLSSFIFEGIVNIESDLYSWDEGNEIEFLEDVPNIQATYQEEWLDNPSFNSPIDPWYNSTEGDKSDVNASAIPGEARFEVLGDSGNFSSTIEEPSYLNSSGDWIATNNPQFPVLPILLDEFGGNSYDPDRESYGTDSTDGLWCAHDYDNNVGNGRVYNTPSIHFKKNYSIGKDLSDYQITSVTLNAVVNGTVCATRPQGGGIEVPGDEQGGGWEYEVYDYARYYVIVSDPDGVTKHEMAYYRTTQLGDDDDYYTTPDGKFDSLDPTPLVTFDEDILIAFLTNVFETSSNEFTITLGIDIYCETNSDPDYDHWGRLNFEQFNFSFTYEKKMSRYAGVAWNQVGDEINGTKYQIDEALLNFEYKSDDLWPTADSPNSEIIVQINNRTHTEVIKLSKINSTWQEAKTGGFDVTSLVRTNENISVSIKLMLMDNFELNETYTVSIDNASLYITYSTAVGGEDTDYELYLNGEDETLSRAIEIKYNEIVNVSFVYLDSFTTFISGADVEITIDSDVKTLTENTTLEHYYILINTTTLHLGENFLPLVALKTGYDSQEFSIKIEVLPLDTDLQLFLDGENRTLEKSAEVTYGKSLNITVLYSNIEEIPGEHIPNATVELLGYGSAKNLTENVTLEHYNITINSTQLGLGITYLTINAEKENFTTQNMVFQIEVVERETYLDNIFINNTETLTYELPWNELFNITVSYNDSLTNTFISNATVKVQGTGFLENFSESVGDDYYIVWLNSSDLKVGIKYLTISAVKENYSIATQVITITVNEKDTEMDIYLNQTMQTLIDIHWNENLNITIVYKDLESGAFIDNATIELREGSTVLFNFSEQLALSHYNLTLNTSILDIGVNALIIYAKKDNYSVALGSITINVFERETDIDIFLNQTQSVSIEIPYGEPLNITIRYRDVETSNYISGATVSLKDGATTLHNLDEQASLNQYNLTLDTSELGVGVHALTIYAKQDNYSAALGNIIINIVERETSLDVYLNQSQTTSIEIAWGEMLNITAIYNDDLSSAFINGANVSLREGTTILYNFTKHPSLNQYNLTLNASVFGLGVNVFTIYANKDNYSASLTSITINVIERETSLEVSLNQSLTTSIEIAWGEMLNITAIYNDEISAKFINGSTVSLKDGTTVLFNFAKHPSLNQYNLTINTSIFNLGVKALTVYANKDNYSVSFESITINVVERETSLEVYLNQSLTTSIEIAWGEMLNITAIYNDEISSTFINGSTLSLKDGTTVLYNFAKHPSLNQYNLTLNTSDFSIGVKILTVYADKDNYSVSLTSITVNIIERETSLDIYLNQTLSNSIEIAWGELLNITAIYTDAVLLSFISGANITLREGTTILFNFSKHPSLNQYNLTLNTSTFDLGVNILTIYAKKENLSVSLEGITINVIERETSLEIYLNQTLSTSIEIPWGEILNITAIYNDSILSSFIDGATLSLRYGTTTLYNLPKHPTLNQYNLTLNTSDFSIGVKILSVYAKKDNFSVSLVSITLNIVERQTSVDIYLNQTLTSSIEIPWGEILNITAIYYDETTSNFIDGATLSLKDGIIVLNNFSQHPSLNQYNLTINTTVLDLGVNVLTIYAKHNNYSLSLEGITISVIEQETSLDVYLNQTLTSSIEIMWGELLNITAIYKDANSAFISGANIVLREGTTTLFNFVEHPSLNQYNLTINTADLGVGVNALTVYAKQDNYSASLENIIVNVIQRDTSLDVYLNQTLTTSIEIAWGELLNITTVYTDVISPAFINGANVTLREGTTILYNFTKHPSLNQYNLTLNASIFGIGVNALTVYAKQDNYSASLGNIIINVIERETELEIFLNETSSLSIEVPWGDLLNITAVYRDLDSSAFLSGATMTLKNGTTVLFNFDEQSQLNQYNLTVNTTIFGVGVKALTVYADKVNYSVSLGSITINVVERETTIEVFLNQTPSISIEIAYGEILNITAVYENLGVYISEANVTIKEGNTVLYNFTEQPLLYQYNLTINTTDFGVGVRALTIYASKENFTVSLQGITVSITSRDTYSVIFLNNEDKTIDKSTTLTNGQLLNITIIYRDTITDNLIGGGSVRVLKGLEWDKSLDENTVFNHYNITLNSTIDLGAGIVFLTIIAENTNYQTYTASLTIFIIDRGTYYNLTIDGQDKTNDPSIERNVNETISIRVYYKDNLTHSHIQNASVRLIQGGTETNLTENATGGYYNISINTLILDQGFNFLTIYAYKEGYIAQQILITVEIIERETALELILNGTLKTTEPSLKITIGYHLNITVRYYDNITKGQIENATVQLLGDYVDNLTEDKTLQQYTIIIDTFDLPSTINFLTIYAYKSNYEPISLVVTIEIITRNTTSKLFLNSQDKTIDRFLNVTFGGFINITITYRDIKSIPEIHISGATVKLIGLGADKFLTENSTFEHYSIIISTTDLQLGSNIFTIECNKSNYLTKSFTNINIFIEERKTGLQLFLNQIDKTTELDINLPIGTNFVITVKYYDLETEEHISGANVQLEGDLTTILTENINLKQFSYTGKTNALDIGISIFSIVAQKSNYETNTIKFKINVERIKTEINTTAGKKLFEILPGESFKLEIVLKDLDFGGNITNASVTYSWQYGEGELQDLDGDGIYEATLIGIPQGIFTITITVFAGDNYRFERFEVTISAYASEEANWLFLALFLIVLVSGLVVSIYTAAYQTYLKYPKPVRKIRKYKKKLKKGKAPDVAIISRKDAYKRNFNEEFSKRSKYIKRLIPDEKERELLKASTEKLALMAPIPIVLAGGLKYKGNEVGVLLIHGGGEDSATEFKELADHLAKTGGFTIRIPFLSEYGSTPEDFLSIRNEDLVNELETELAGLKEKSKIVIVGGHSLGGILALYLSAKMNPDLVFTINAPSSIEEYKPESLPIFKVFKDEPPLYKDELQRIAEGDVKDIDRTPLKMASKINELVDTSKKSLKDVKSPTLLLQGRKDKVIKSSSIDDIYRVIKSEPKKKVWLENSTHSLIENLDKETLFSEISNFINEALEKRIPKKKPKKELEAKPEEKPKEKPKSEPKEEPKPELKKEPEHGPKPITKELPKKESKSEPAPFTTITPPKIELRQPRKEKPKKEPEVEPKKESKAKPKEEQKKETKTTPKKDPKSEPNKKPNSKPKEESKAEPEKESNDTSKKSEKKNKNSKK